MFSVFAMKNYIEDAVESAGQVGAPEPVFIAFSPANPRAKEYARILDEGMKKLRSSGRLEKILGKYGIKDWAK